MCGFCITNRMSSIKHLLCSSWLKELEITNRKGEVTMGFKITTSQCLRSLLTTDLHARRIYSRLYFNEKNTFGDDWWKPVDFLAPSILFIIWSHVAKPAMLLCWKNWVINYCQSHHFSGNWGSIFGHWRITQIHSWPALSVPLLYESTKWHHNYGTNGISWLHCKKKLPE